MKKHFTGIALFIFIVGISGFVASLFVEIPKPEVIEVQSTIPVYESRKKCSKNYRNRKTISNSVEITQMVYQEHNGYIAASFLLKPEHKMDEVSFDLHFFVKDANETHFLITEKVFLETKKNLVFIEDDGRGDFLATLFFESLTKLDSRKNLYVIAETEAINENGGRSGDLENIPVFDESKAFGVVVIKD